MNDTVDVVMCPYCGDSWITDNKDITNKSAYALDVVKNIFQKKQQKCGDLYIKH